MYNHDSEASSRSYKRRVIVPYPEEARDRAAHQAFDEYLAGRRLDAKLARQNGWYPSRDFRGRELRIVIPATNTGGYPFWQARAVEAGIEPRYDSPHGVPREDSVIVLYPSAALAPQTGRLVVIVEGPMDALAVAAHGKIAVALMGAMPPLLVYYGLARRWRGAAYLVVPDNDAVCAGVRTARLLAQHGRDVRLCLLPENVKDFAELPEEARQQFLDGCVCQ